MTKKLAVFLLFGLITSCDHVFDSVKEKTITQDKEKIYNIAVLLPLSGKNANIGKSLLKVINLAYANNPNQNIVLKIYDTEGNVEVAAKIAKQVISDKNQAVLGPLLADEAKVVASALAKYSIPVFTLSNDVKLISSIENLYSVAVLASSEIEATIAYLIKNKNAKSFALLAPNNKYGQLMVENISKYLNKKKLKLVRVVTYPVNTPKLSTYVGNLLTETELKKVISITNKLKNNKNKIIQDDKGNIVSKPPSPNLDFDTLIIADFGQRAAILASYLPSFSIEYKTLNIIGVSALDDPITRNNNILGNAYFATINDVSNTKFAVLYNKLYNNSLKSIEIAAYDSLQILMSAVYKDDEDNLVSDFTNNHLISYNKGSLAGNIKITPDKVALRNMTIKQIANKATTGTRIIEENMPLENFMENYTNMPMLTTAVAK